MVARPSAKASAWNALDVLLRQVFNFVAMIVLARLLAPEDFGIIALISFFSSVVIAVLQTGLATALIQKASISPLEESAAFWWSLVASSVAAGGLLVAAPALAEYYDYPMLSPLMAVASGQIILTALASIQSALLARELRFAVLAKAGIASTLISGLLAICAAAMGAGIWSLALQLLASALLNTMIVWHLSGWRPTAHFDLGSLKSLLTFGGYLSVSNFLEVLYTQGFSVIVGKRYGANDLGLFNRAMALQLVPSSAIAVIVSRIALPLLSAQAADQQEMLSTFRRLSRLAMFVNVPLMCGLAVLADQVIVVLYGGNWISAAPILAILSLGAVFLPLHAINLQLLLAQGRARAYFWIEVMKKVFGVTCIVIGSFNGLIGLAYGMLIAGLIALFLNTFMTKRMMQFGLFAQLADLAGIFFCTGIMVATVLTLRSAFPLPLLLSLPMLVTAGAATYLSLGAALRLQSFREALDIGTELVTGRAVRLGP